MSTKAFERLEIELRRIADANPKHPAIEAVRRAVANTVTQLRLENDQDASR